MVKVIWCCDGCGKELTPSYDLLMNSQTKEWPMAQYMFCKECALEIDNTILRLRASISER